MNKLKFITGLLFVAFLFSCNPNKVFEEHSSNFPNNTWDKANVVKFSPEIKDKNSKYNIYVAFRHHAVFHVREVSVKVEISSPAGVLVEGNYLLSVYDKNNKMLSDCAGDYCDLKTLILPDFQFKETGKYQVKISYSGEIEPLPNAMDAGLVIEKKE